MSMAVGRRWSRRVLIGRTWSGAGIRQTLRRASVAVLVSVFFALHFVHIEVAERRQLRPEG